MTEKKYFLNLPRYREAVADVEKEKAFYNGEKAWTMTGQSKILGCDRRMMNYYLRETNQHAIPLSKLQILAMVLGVNELWLCGLSDRKHKDARLDAARIRDIKDKSYLWLCLCNLYGLNVREDLPEPHNDLVEVSHYDFHEKLSFDKLAGYENRKKESVRMTQDELDQFIEFMSDSIKASMDSYFKLIRTKRDYSERED